MKLENHRWASTVVAVGCAALFSLVSPAASMAVGPDGANHSSRATAYGPLTPGTMYSGYNGYSGDVDVYSIQDAVANGNLVINVQDKYSGEDPCTFWTSCDLVVAVYDSNANEIDAGNLCAEPASAATQMLPVTLPTPGLYYIVISTDYSNIDCGLGPSQDGQTIPYSFSVQPSTGIGVAPAPTPTQTPTPPQDPTPTQPTPTPTQCTVPAVQPGASLAVVRRRITANHCSVGRVWHVYSRSVRRGHLVALAAEAHVRLPNGSRVGIVLSAGRKPRRA